MRTNLIARAAAAGVTRAKWFGQPFGWGASDCVTLAADHLRELRVPVLLPAARWRSVRGARAAIRREGFADLGAALQAHGLEEIPPAAALIADLHLLPGEGGLDAIGIDMGNRAMLCFIEGAGACGLMRLERPHRAFRAPV